MSSRSSKTLLREAKSLSRQTLEGGRKAPDAFCNLVQIVLGNTVLDDGQAPVLKRGMDEDVFEIRAPEEGRPFKLRDDRFLDLRLQFFLDTETKYLKVSKSKFQYQADEKGDRWIFRYEYLRTPGPKYLHPQAHLHVRGTLSETCNPKKGMLEKVHFPTRRVAFESIVRLLAEQFNVPCKVEASTWKPTLAYTEKAFLRVRHEPTPQE